MSTPDEKTERPPLNPFETGVYADKNCIRAANGWLCHPLPHVTTAAVLMIALDIPAVPNAEGWVSATLKAGLAAMLLIHSVVVLRDHAKSIPNEEQVDTPELGSIERAT